MTKRLAQSARAPRFRGARNTQISTPMVVNKVQNQLSEELKLYPVTLSATFGGVSTTGTALSVTGLISQGTGVSQRIANSIRLLSMGWEGQLVGGQSNISTDDQRNCFRITVARLNKGATATFLASYTVNQVLDSRYIAGLRHVLYDKVISMASPGKDSTGYMPACVVSRGALRFNEIVNYTGTGTDAESTDIIVLAMVSDSNVVPNPGFTSGSLVLRFADA